MTYDPPSPPLRSTQRSLPIALLRARETVMGPIREMLAQSGVNEQKWRVLRVLDERGPMELTVLAAASVLMLPSLTRMVRPLEEEGLILRSTPSEDRRKVVVGITEAGRQLIRTHLAESNAIFAKLEAEFGAAKLAQLLDLLEELQAMDLRGQPGEKG
jgi:homoprotocatechuate degradation regulator HpaR